MSALDADTLADTAACVQFVHAGLQALLDLLASSEGGDNERTLRPGPLRTLLLPLADQCEQAAAVTRLPCWQGVAA